MAKSSTGSWAIGGGIEAKPKKTRQGLENTANSRQPLVTRLVRSTEDKENDIF